MKHVSETGSCLGARIYDRVSVTLDMDGYEDAVTQAWYALSTQEQDELDSDNKKDLQHASVRTQFIYAIGEAVYELFPQINDKTPQKPRYFLLSDAPKNMAECIVDCVYEELTGTAVESELVHCVSHFLGSLTPKQLKQVCKHEKKNTRGRSCLKTKFLGHIGQQVLNWLAPKFF